MVTVFLSGSNLKEKHCQPATKNISAGERQILFSLTCESSPVKENTVPLIDFGDVWQNVQCNSMIKVECKN